MPKTVEMDLRDVSSLRVVAGLELSGAHELAMDVAGDITSEPAKAAAKIITSSGSSNNAAARRLAEEVIESIK
jgi:hypothetical protein